MHPTIAEARHQLLELLRSESFRLRDVVLASGQNSQVYIDCKQILFRGDAQLAMGILFSDMLQRLESAGAHFVGCCGMALGAVPMCAALSLTAMGNGRFLPGVIVRKQAKDHGTSATIEGASSVQAPAHLLLLEDVVTTGGSSILAIQQLRAAGYTVDTAFALVDRKAGGRENLKAQGVTLHALYALEGEILVYANA